MGRALVIDGNSLIYRVFYASFKQLEFYKQHNLQPVNALKLTLLIILKILNNTHYDYGLVAFDAAKKTLRHEELEEYKAGRKPMPEDLVSQLPLIKEAIQELGLVIMSMDGIEADDIIGSYCKNMNQNGIHVDIYSSDKDMLQLVNQNTFVHLFKTGISDIQCVNLENFTEVFHGLTPAQVTDFKGISGDSSDNLVGVKGIGPVTAIKLISAYGTLENILAHLDELSPNIKVKFENDKQHTLLCKKLSTIDQNVLSSFNIDDFVNKGIDQEKLRSIVQK
jgi:DNA polymerase-1